MSQPVTEKDNNPAERLVQFIQSQVESGKFSLTNETLVFKFKGGITGFERYSLKQNHLDGLSPVERPIDRTMTEMYMDFINLTGQVPGAVKNIAFFNVIDVLKFEAKGEVAKGLNALVQQSQVKSAQR